MEATRHITWKELKAVELALHAVGPLLYRRTVALFSDSSVVVSLLKRMYTKSSNLRSTLSRIIRLVRRLGVRL